MARRYLGGIGRYVFRANLGREGGLFLTTTEQGFANPIPGRGPFEGPFTSPLNILFGHADAPPARLFADW